MRNLFLFLSIIFFPSFSFGDLIKINDGSIVSGKITKFDKDTISLKTEFAGTIKIERDKVLSVDSKEDFSIKLKGGKKALGSLTRDAKKINIIRKESGWQGLYIGGTAFKKQREVDPSMYGYSARLAANHMDVIVTSGIATGHAVDLKKINIFRQNCGETTLAVASGINPENVNEYIKNVDLFMVATGINFNNDFYNIDPNKLNKLMNIIESDGENYEHR